MRNPVGQNRDAYTYASLSVKEVYSLLLGVVQDCEQRFFMMYSKQLDLGCASHYKLLTRIADFPRILAQHAENPGLPYDKWDNPAKFLGSDLAHVFLAESARRAVDFLSNQNRDHLITAFWGDIESNPPLSSINKRIAALDLLTSSIGRAQTNQALGAQHQIINQMLATYREAFGYVGQIGVIWHKDPEDRRKLLAVSLGAKSAGVLWERNNRDLDPFFGDCFSVSLLNYEERMSHNRQNNRSLANLTRSLAVLRKGLLDKTIKSRYPE